MKADYKNWVPNGMIYGCGAWTAWCVYANGQFSYDGKRQLSRQIV